MKHFDKIIKLFYLHEIINDSDISETVRKNTTQVKATFPLR